MGLHYSGKLNLRGKIKSNYVPPPPPPSWENPIQQSKLFTSDPGALDYVGNWTAISGDGNTFVVGVPEEDTGGTQKGSMYVFSYNGSVWSEQAKIQTTGTTNPNDGNGLQFSTGVDISNDGNTIIAGILRDSHDNVQRAGGAAIFHRSNGTWTQSILLRPSDRLADDFAGLNNAISGDGNTAVVGCLNDDSGASTNCGSIYIFRKVSNTNWTQQATLFASNKQAHARLSGGTKSIAISTNGNTVIVGAEDHDLSNPSRSDAGSVYVFTWSGSSWSEQQILVASDGLASDHFGHSISASGSGDTVIISAYSKTVSSLASAGAAYVFTRSGTSWTQQQQLVAADPEANAVFGYSVALSEDGNTAVVGAKGKNSGSNNDAGAVYVFTRSNNVWTQVKKIETNPVIANISFGSSVSISSDAGTIVAGAAADDTYGSNAGAIYTFIKG